MKGVKTMDDMIATLEKIGIPAEQCESIRKHYDGDIDGLTRYVLYCIALFDDRNQYYE